MSVATLIVLSSNLVTCKHFVYFMYFLFYNADLPALRQYFQSTQSIALGISWPFLLSMMIIMFTVNVLKTKSNHMMCKIRLSEKCYISNSTKLFIKWFILTYGEMRASLYGDDRMNKRASIYVNIAWHLYMVKLEGVIHMYHHRWEICLLKYLANLRFNSMFWLC
jgi:hypothetical protein